MVGKMNHRINFLLAFIIPTSNRKEEKTSNQESSKAALGMVLMPVTSKQQHYIMMNKFCLLCAHKPVYQFTNPQNILAHLQIAPYVQFSLQDCPSHPIPSHSIPSWNKLQNSSLIQTTCYQNKDIQKVHSEIISPKIFCRKNYAS